MVVPKPPLPPAAPQRRVLSARSLLALAATRSSWVPLLLLMSMTGTRAEPDSWPLPLAATAGVAGGARGAELADMSDVDLNNGSLPSHHGAVPMAGVTKGSIREALGGGVAELHAGDVAWDAASTPAGPGGPEYPEGPEDPVTPGGFRTGSSRCSSPRACLRVEQCAPAGADVLFECAAGKVCCVPATPTKLPPRIQPQHPADAFSTQQAWPQESPQASQQPVQPVHQSVHPVHPVQTTPEPQYQFPRPQGQSQDPPPRPANAQRPRPQQPQQAVHPEQPQSAHQKPHKHPPPSESSQYPQQQPQRPQAQPSPQLPQHSYSQEHVQAQHPHDPPGQQGNLSHKPPKVPPANPLSLLPETGICGKISTENRITQGKIAQIGQFPWMALLGYRQGGGNVTFLCGGTLINERYVLTAAHCFSKSNLPVVVRLGEFNLTEAVDCDHDKVCAPPPLDIGVEDVIIHRAFNFRTIKHDIALIRLAASVPEFSEFVRPICLPLGVNVTDDRKFKIAGWGKTDFKHANGSPVLQYTDIGGVGHAECNELQPLELRPLDEGQLCAGGDKGKDACKGDSGGPLMVALALDQPSLPDIPIHVTYQIGVVSYGPDSPCGTAPLPSIYTRVSTYVPWILATLRP